MSAVLWCSMSSGFVVSHFSVTTSHCEQAAFSFIMKTLEKQECSEVKEEESGCCVKGGGGGGEKEMEVGVKRGER